MKKVLKYLRKNWIKHAFETLVVTVGILGAFALSNLKEARTERVLEIKILGEIRQNLILDIVDHEQNIDFLIM